MKREHVVVTYMREIDGKEFELAKGCFMV